MFFPGGFGFRHVGASGFRGVPDNCCFKCLVSEVGFGFSPGFVDWGGSETVCIFGRSDDEFCCCKTSVVPKQPKHRQI